LGQGFGKSAAVTAQPRNHRAFQQGKALIPRVPESARNGSAARFGHTTISEMSTISLPQ
jgi:hypothetical protein